MTHSDLRDKFFKFWGGKPRAHKLIPSSPLVPENDPTTLFTGSGMQPLIPYLLGQEHPLGKRLVDIQKCFRGQDIDEVGDNRHDSFFEMMGNWSLGDYFKKEQLTWYFEFLTEGLGLNPEKMYITCFEGNEFVPKDTESVKIWRALGIPEERIYFYSGKSNWWSRSGPPENMPAGEIGGPNSEVFYEFSHVAHNPKFGEHCHPNCDCGRFIEIGNSVFITYQKTPDGTFSELPQKNVDFGGGLERTLAALNNDPDIFKTDVFWPIIVSLENLSGIKYGTNSDLDIKYRVIADHIRAVVFLIAEGVYPSNVDRGYVLRRLIRRTIRFGRHININKQFIDSVIESVVAIYEQPYPELRKKQELIAGEIIKEENKFQNTLEKGLKEFEKLAMKGTLSPKEVFYLYESFGFPYELTEEEANDKKVKIATRKEYDEEYEKHKEQSRTAGKGMFKGGLADHSQIVTKYHTATHLLQAALRSVLGEQVHQEGSNLTAERLRFDFSFDRKITNEELHKITTIVNEQIKKGLSQKRESMSYHDAVKSGAMAFFKERYPEMVTVYSFGEFSKEICGGPHVKNTNELGNFKIIKEEAVASGVRRIYATLT